MNHNRFVILAVLVLAGSFAGGFFGQWLHPATVQADEPKTITTNEIKIVDPAGNVMIHLGYRDGAGTLMLLNQGAKRLAGLGFPGGWPSLSCSTVDGSNSMIVGLSEGKPTVIGIENGAPVIVR